LKLQKLKLGASVGHVLQPEVPNSQVSMYRSWTFYGMYDFGISENLTLSPNIMYAWANEFNSLNFNLKGTYKDCAWISLGLISRDQITAGLGGTIKKRYSVGFAYRVTISKLNTGTSGTQVLYLKYVIAK
ncbi:MAG: type IX secretion system membrane protein PorP/SprF, partial [Flavobacteriales bacterium]|nr:type IX secretion system membrane protein PorP/SprF [Flavobacteriales bacterium]